MDTSLNTNQKQGFWLYPDQIKQTRLSPKDLPIRKSEKHNLQKHFLLWRHSNLCFWVLHLCGWKSFNHLVSALTCPWGFVQLFLCASLFMVWVWICVRVCLIQYNRNKWKYIQVKFQILNGFVQVYPSHERRSQKWNASLVLLDRMRSMRFVVLSAGRSRGGCVRCQQSHSLQTAVKVLYGFVAFLIIIVAVLASLGEKYSSQMFSLGPRVSCVLKSTLIVKLQLCEENPQNFLSSWIHEVFHIPPDSCSASTDGFHINNT